MSTQNKFDLILAGNITVDEIYEINEWPKVGTSNQLLLYKSAIGGIGNHIEALKNSGLKIYVCGNIGKDDEGEKVSKYLTSRNIEKLLFNTEKSTSKAVILSSLNGSERTSFVNWGCGTDTLLPPPIKAKWMHVSYLDICSDIDLNEMKSTCDIISADLCLSNPSKKEKEKVLENIKHIDYLFISEIEKMAYENLHGPTVVVHSRKNTIIYNKEKRTYNGNHLIIDGINVLGAGDAYCANFILCLLNKKTEQEAAEIAHIKATEFIKEKYEKI